MTTMKQTGRIRRMAVGLLSAVLCAAMAFLSAGAKGYDFPKDAAPVSVTLDGEAVLAEEAVILDSVTYVPLRSFAELVGADSINWDAKTSTATVKKGSMTLTVTDGSRYVEASGRVFYTAAPVRNISNRLFVPIRPMAKAFSMELAWDGANRTVVLRNTGKTLTPGSAYYDQTDLYWLSRIISAESAGESLEGRIAVGNVVLNRKAHRAYPNTVYGVIFDRVGGVQFTPVAIGTVYKTPTAGSVIAAKICLEGYSLSEDILFFMNPRIATGNWISQNRTFAFRIGNHDFYY